MQQAMAPPEGYGSPAYDTYPHHRRQEGSGYDDTPSSARHVGYREDYSRAQHASLEQEHYSITRAHSDIGPSVSQEQLRFSAHVNRFASHDPRITTPVPTNNNNRSVSVSERIKRFNDATEAWDSDNHNTRQYQQQPPSPQRHEQTRYYPTHSKRGRSMQQQQKSELSAPSPEQAPVRPTQASTSSSSYRRNQEMAQDHYPSESRQRQQPSPSTSSSYSRQKTPTSQSLTKRSVSRERERQSRSPAAARTAAEPSTTTGTRSERNQRSRSPGTRLTTESNLGSPSRASETQRAARSLLAKRRQRRLEQEAMNNAGEEQNQRGNPDGNRTNGTETRRQPESRPSREEGRTDRILREARSRSMSPRTSRYSRKAYGIPPPSSPLVSGGQEKPERASDNSDKSTPKRRSHAWDPHAASAKESGRQRKYPASPQVAIRQQEPVSPMTPGSANVRTPSSNAHAPSSPKRSGSPSSRSLNTSGSNTSSVQELKRQLWDNNETLQVAVKPSLTAHGYSDRRTKQTTGYYAPEMAGHEGQRVRSLSPNPKQQVHGHERPAIPTEPQGNRSKFNSKFVKAALSSHRDGHTSPVPEGMARSRSSSPNFRTAYPSSTVYRHPPHHPEHRRSESPRPPFTPGRGSPLRSSFDEGLTSPRTGSSTPRTGSSPAPDSTTHSIERVLSSAGASTATGEASVAKLVAKLTSVSREDPEKALKMIDSILKAESKSSSGEPGSRSCSQTESRGQGFSPIAAGSHEEIAHPEDDDDASESSETSCDDTSVSSITNPTYQRDDKAYPHGHAVSTSGSRNPRQSSLNKYSQLQPSPSQDGSRGKSSKARKEKKPPPPATIKVNRSDSGGSRPDDKKSKKGNGSRGSLSSKKVRALSPPSKDRRSRSLGNNNAMDPAAIAMKIRGWDEQLDSYELGATPLSPTRTEDTGVTAATEDLGSIITPQSQKLAAPSENRRSHPWDDSRYQSTTKPKAIDLTVPTGTNSSAFEKKEAKAFEPTSPWQRRRASKETGNPNQAKTRSDVDEERTTRRQYVSAQESPRIAPNAYDVHRNRRRRSRSREVNADKSRSLIDQNVEGTAQPSSVNPFDSGYVNPPKSTRSETRNPFDAEYEGRPTTAKSDTGNPFDSSYKIRPRPTRSGGGNPFDSDYESHPSGSKSDTGVFDSAWGAIPSHAFGSSTAYQRSSKASTSPQRVEQIETSPAQEDLPPRTPTHRLPYGKEEAPEASLDPSAIGGRRRRRSLLKMKRTATPKKERDPPQPTGSKPLLSPYAMDSVDADTGDIRDEFKLPSKSSGRNTRSRTVSPGPRKVKKSKSPGRNRLRMNRNDSFTDGEDESSSLTGSLTGSTTSSVRNKNLAKKFSRFLKVYED